MGLRKRSSATEKKVEIKEKQMKMKRLENLLVFVGSLLRKKCSLPSCLRPPHVEPQVGRCNALPSREELERPPPVQQGVDFSRTLPPLTLSKNPVHCKIETPYWIIRQRLSKNAVIYEESVVGSTIGRREGTPPTTDLSAPPSYGARWTKNFCLNGENTPRNSECSFETANSLDSTCYKTLPNSRRTSGYSLSIGNEPNFSSPKNSYFKETDGYKLWACPQIASKNSHDYFNFH